MDSSRLLKRIAVFVAAYLAMSAFLTYFVYDDDATSISDTVTYNGNETTVKVFFEDASQEQWAYDMLDTVTGTLPSLIEAFGEQPPYSTLVVEASSLDSLDGYPFELQKSTNKVSAATEYSSAGAIWGLARMWIDRGNTTIPDWVVWGQSAFFAYAALENSNEALASEFDTVLVQGAQGLVETFSLESYEMPGNAYDDIDSFNYFMGTSYLVYKDLSSKISIEEINSIHDGVLSSMNQSWDTDRYVSYVSDKASADVSDVFTPAVGGDVGSTISTWKLFHYLEYAGALVVIALIVLFSFWGQVKKRLSRFTILRERNPIMRQMLRKYGSYDRIMMELESYFKRKIPEDQFDSFIKRFYQETHLKNNTN